MPAGQRLFSPYATQSPVIQVQYRHRGASDACQSDDSDAFPGEMHVPNVTARMKQASDGSGLWIKRLTSIAFAQGASDTCECETANVRWSTIRTRADVIDMERGGLSLLCEPAILTSAFGSDKDKASQTRGNVLHFLGLRFATRWERRRNKERISAISTRPSASSRSDRDNLPSRLCLSRRCCKRRSRAFGKRNCLMSPGISTQTITAHSSAGLLRWSIVPWQCFSFHR